MMGIDMDKIYRMFDFYAIFFQSILSQNMSFFIKNIICSYAGILLNLAIQTTFNNIRRDVKEFLIGID
jgi:hypothetical protein